MRSKLTLLLLAVALVAGCGGSSRLSKAQFEQRIKADGRAVEQAVAKVDATPTSMQVLAKQVAAAEQAVKAAADDLAAAKPPADAEGSTKTIVRALRTIDAQLQKLEQAAKKSDIIAAQAAAAAIQGSPEVKAAQTAAADLKKKGYDIGAIGR
jgi:chromosome segregation ATPase